MTYDQWKTRCDQADADSAPDDADYYEYQLQCAFEDLCGRVGYKKAIEAMSKICGEHVAMLKRQGRW